MIVGKGFHCDDYRKRQKVSVEERFWSKVDKTGNCWLWTANSDRRGYGKFSLQCHTYRSHRVAYQIAVGPVPDEMLILHKCDTPACVNPDHLYVGTHQMNMKDRQNKGRAAYGKRNGMSTHPETILRREASPRAKITMAIADSIRKDHAEGFKSHQKLGAKYGIKKSQVHNILTGKQW